MPREARQKLAWARTGLGLGLGLLSGDAVRIESYVATKALDGLYCLIAEQERNVRHDPAAVATNIVKNVFGVLR